MRVQDIQAARCAGAAAATPPGFKATPAGAIPCDWDVVRIDKHASIKTGARNTQDAVADGSYPFFVRSQHIERINSYSFEGEAVLTAGDGVGTGKIFHYVDGRFDVHQRVYRITDFTERLDGKYFFYQFSTRFYDRIMSMTAKSSVDSVRMEMIAGMMIPLPDPEEQSAIAEALSDIDALIESLDKLIAKKRDIKQAAMQELLTGRTRLPGYEKEWETRRLGDISEIVMGQSPSSVNYNTGGNGLPLIQGNADIANRRTIKRIFTTQITKRGCEGDILMSVRAPVGEISRATFDICLGRGVCALRFPNDFLYHSLILLEPAWARYSKGSTFDSISSTDLRMVEIEMPSDGKEQETIATVLSDMDAEIAAVERRRDKAVAIKQGIMQELLTGRIRLVKPEVTS